MQSEPVESKLNLTARLGQCDIVWYVCTGPVTLSYYIPWAKLILASEATTSRKKLMEMTYGM